MKPPRLEVAVDHAEAVLSASHGGAERLELCSSLADGGLTPSLGLLQWAVERVSVPVYCMVRPRAGGFCYSAAELEVMQWDIAALKSAGASGLVLGVLTSDRRVDVAATRRLVEAAAPLPVVFHRAFDLTVDLNVALEDVIATGAKVLLTSGGAASLEAGADRVKTLVTQANGRIQMMGGAGVRASNAGMLWRDLGLDTLHTSLRREWKDAVLVGEAQIGSRDEVVYTVHEEDVRDVLNEIEGVRWPRTINFRGE